MNISYDYGATWYFVENLPLAQFYHINVDDHLPYNVYGGMQDNGSWMGPAYSLTVDGIRNEEYGHSFCVYGLVPKLSKIMVPYRAWAVCTSRKKLDLEPFIGKIDIFVVHLVIPILKNRVRCSRIWRS